MPCFSLLAREEARTLQSVISQDAKGGFGVPIRKKED